MPYASRKERAYAYVSKLRKMIQSEVSIEINRKHDYSILFLAGSERMKNALLRITSALIIASLMLSVTSCNNAAPKKSGKVIATDSPWYDATIIDVKTGVDANKNVSLFNHYYVGSDENYYPYNRRI